MVTPEEAKDPAPASDSDQWPAVSTTSGGGQVPVGEEGLHRPGQGWDVAHRVIRHRIRGLCRGEADDSTHGLRVCQPGVTWRGKWGRVGVVLHIFRRVHAVVGFA